MPTPAASGHTPVKAAPKLSVPVKAMKMSANPTLVKWAKKTVGDKTGSESWNTNKLGLWQGSLPTEFGHNTTTLQGFGSGPNVHCV